MNRLKTIALAAPLALVLALPSQSAFADRKDRKGLAIGLGIGLLGAAVASNGDPGAMIGGALVGGVIGHEISRDKDRRKYREWRRDRRDDWRHRRDDRRRDYDRDRY